MKKAIVTILIGKKFQTRWKNTCADGWKAYAKRHDYHLICIREPLDCSPVAITRSPSWQKCLIFNHPEVASCDRIVWVDADVIITKSAPDIVQAVPVDKVGAVEHFAHLECGQIAHEILVCAQLESGLPVNAQDMYKSASLPDSFTQVVQAGVMVLSPAHRECLENVYRNGTDNPNSFYEMMPLSSELLKKGVVHWIDKRFNDTIMETLMKYYPFFVASSSRTPFSVKLRKFIARKLFLRLCIDASLRNSWFFHFAGYGEYMDSTSYWGQLFK